MKRIAIVLLLFGCLSCSDEPVKTVFFDLDTTNGVYIACEGNFMYGNSSLSFYNYQTKKVNNQLFYARNNAPLGDVAQSLATQNNTLFIVMNNSGKIYAVDSETIKYKGSVTGLTSPRYIHFISDEKAYVTDLYAQHITVFNPETFEITDTIHLDGHTSEQMVQIGNLVYVTSWNFDKYILVIDAATNQLVNKIEVPFQPKDLQIDINGKIWVLSQGSTEGFSEPDQLSALSRIDPATKTIEQVYRFKKDDLPAGLKLNATRDTLYFINQGIYKMPVTSRHLPDSAFIRPRSLFYSLGINPKSGELYVSDAIDYTQDALVYRFSVSGTLLDSFRVGINPSDYLFK